MTARNEGARNAFVLMPFGPGWDEIYRDLLAKPLSEAGYEVARADTFLTHRNVLRDIVRGIGEADLIVAEISTPNPNVLYELGLAQGLGIPTVLVAQDLDEVPFDLRSYRIEQYSTNFAEVEDFRERLKRTGLEHIAGRVVFGSPVSDFLGEPGSAAREIGVDLEDVIQEPAREIDPAEGPAGFLDHAVLLEDATAALERAFVEITDDISSLGEAANAKGTRITALGESPGGINPRDLFRLTTSMANDMTAFAQSLDRRLPNMEARTQDLIEAGAGVAQWIADGISENRSQVVEFRESMADLAEIGGTAIGQMAEMRDSTGSVRGTSRELDQASRRVEASVGRLIDVMTQIESFAVKAQNLASEALDSDESNSEPS